MPRPRVPRGLRAEKLAALVFPAPVSSPTLPRCLCAPGPGSATTSCRRSRLHSRWLPATIRAVRPAAIGWGGRPSLPGCYSSTSANAGRSPEDHRRPERSGLDPMLFDRDRSAGPTQALPLRRPRRTRSSSSPPDPPPAPAVRVGCALNGPLRSRIDPDMGRQEIQNRTASSDEEPVNDPQRTCLTLAVRSAPWQRFQ